MVERRDDESPDKAGEEDVVMVEAPTETLEEILAEEEAEARRAASSAASTDPPADSALAQAQDEIAALKDREIRKLAEFENFKKRTEREKADYFRFALADFFRDLLPVLDNFERALGHAPAAADDEYRQGIELIYRQFSDALKKRGITEVPTTGTFDPNVHEAVAREETPGAEPNSIVAVLQKGYFLNDRLLRPAFVKVAAAPHDKGHS